MSEIHPTVRLPVGETYHFSFPPVHCTANDARQSWNSARLKKESHESEFGSKSDENRTVYARFKTSHVTRRPSLKRLSGIQVQLLSLCMGKHQILQNCSLSLLLNFIFEITNEIGQQLCHKCGFFCSNSIIKSLFLRFEMFSLIWWGCQKCQPYLAQSAATWI